MSTVAEFTIPIDALPGGQLLSELPELRIEIERIVPTDEAALPFFWVFGESTDEYLSRVRGDIATTLQDIRVLDRTDDAALVRAYWKPEGGIVNALTQLDPTIMEAVGMSSGWYFQVRAESRADFRMFQEAFEAAGIAISLDRLYDTERELEERLEGTVTAVQERTLVAAYEAGYYDQPRRATQQELAEQFDVSSQAIAARLRRGTRNLVESVLVSAR